MIALNAHYDGKVLVPDEPLDLPANQKVRISIEPIDPRPQTVDLSKLLGMGLRDGPVNPNPRFADENSLWEGTTGNHLENGPNNPKR